MSHPVTAVVIGGGARGTIYACYALDFPEKFKVVLKILFFADTFLIAMESNNHLHNLLFSVLYIF